MAEFAKEVQPVSIEDELRRSYLDYAMSVIVGRALPDVRDGLKPVHRRVLFAMRELNNSFNESYKKSARVVGDVIGKYHPHGDSAVYDAIVRMAQPFSLRYLLVDGQGNFGSVDGDSPAAMRYTEVRMTRLAGELLADIEHDTVDFVPNYDASEQMPSVLPARVPNLLINGAAGIAVGMATNIPPHNLAEVIAACLALIDDPELDCEQLMECLPGPDLPTAGIINGCAGIRRAYREGRGSMRIRARAELITPADAGGRQHIVVSEIPYQVNKARLVERIAALVRARKLTGISELRDESDKDGVRIVIELRRGEMGDVLLNRLYALTALEVSFGINMVALVDGVPQRCNLKQLLEYFLAHRREVITRRSLHLLRKARLRTRLLEGLLVASANIDAVVELVRKAPSPAVARESLMGCTWPCPVAQLADPALLRDELELAEPTAEPTAEPLRGEYQLSEPQANAILELRLQRLTGLEQGKILDEYHKKVAEIGGLLEILRDPDRLTTVLRAELHELLERYGDERRTELVEHQEDLEEEDLIPDEPRIVTVSRDGYALAQSPDEFRAQRRGGTGKQGAGVGTEDLMATLLVARSHNTLLCFSDHGRVYWLKVYRIPMASRGTRGRPLVNLLSLADGERVTALLPVSSFEVPGWVLLATAQGRIKKVPLSAFSRPRTSGVRAIGLLPGDELVAARLSETDESLMMFGSNGKGIRFSTAEVRAQHRPARGVIGLRLPPGQRLVAMVLELSRAGTMLIGVTQAGYGKLLRCDDFPHRHRGGQGVIALRVGKRNGALVAVLPVQPGGEAWVVSDRGTLLRIPIDEVPVLGRGAAGVRIARLRSAEQVADVACFHSVSADAEVASSEAAAGDADRA